jgi:predicted permease
MTSWLDIKLGLRMLAKHPSLTVVGGLAMAVAVAIAAGFFGIIYSMMDPTLPLPDGNRIVSIQNWDDGAEDRPERQILHDVLDWRAQSKTVEDIGAVRLRTRNVVTPYGDIEPLHVAEMSAAGFKVTQVKPLRGRYLTDADEQPNAAPVVVIGEEIWRERYLRDPRILDKSLDLAGTTHRIVGVMPEGYAFPLRHSIWVPLKLDTIGVVRREGPVIHAFGRLAPRVTMEAAQAEFTRIGKAAAAHLPATHAQLRPTVLPYAYPWADIDNTETVWAYHALQTSVTLLLVLICANIATLIYARTATRTGEIAVRTALGASRRRIIGQLFAEALVLAVLASAVGLLIAKWALSQIGTFLDTVVGELPFWMDFDLSLGVMLYVVGVTVLAAMIMGALPALQVTGRRLQPKLRELGGGSGLKLGRTWTVLIVAQVAFAVAIMPATLYYAWEFVSFGVRSPGFAAEEFLTATIGLESANDATTAADSTRPAALQRELVERLRAESGVANATFALAVPTSEPTAMIEVAGLALPQDSVNYSLGEGTRRGFGVRANHVDPTFFDIFGIKLKTGTYARNADEVTVNDAFARTILGGANPVGKRFRYVGRGGDTDSADFKLGRWYRIVGVINNFPRREMDPKPRAARVYHTPDSGRLYGTLIVHVNNRPAANYIPRVRQLANSVDPALQLRNVTPISEIIGAEQRMYRLGGVALVAMTLSVLLLSAAGIYSLMSLTVDQRRREIGVRSALGAQPRLLLRTVFARAGRQLIIGVAAGVAAALVLDRLMWGEVLRGQGAVLLPLVSALMVTVGLIAAAGPARRGLRIQPTEALREQ